MAENLKNVKKLYFIGIGGISMSAIALILQRDGYEVSGSDFSDSEEVKKLREHGIKVNIGHKAENITGDIDVVIYSKAIHEDNEEMVKARSLGIKLMSRSAALGAIMYDFNKRICIAGTHGKTTTTAIISKVLLDKKLDPTINIGGIVDEVGGNVHMGSNKDIFVAEACEYTNSFHDFYPTTAVITNIDVDHLDFFKDLANIRASFKKFISLLPDDGTLIINKNISDIDYLVGDKKLHIVTYGDSDTADYYFSNICYDDEHHMSFDVYHEGIKVGSMRQRLIGKHNAFNFIAAYACLAEYGIKFDFVKTCIEDFVGAKRRLEIKGSIKGITFIDDYAHHPAEIEASLSALKSLNYEHMYLIFQPHTFSRTKALIDDFARVLSCFDNVILAKIYPAREKDLGIISSKDVQGEIIKHQANKSNIPEYFETFENICEYVSKKAKPKDIVVTMGAGDVYKIYDMCKEIL